MPVPSGDRLAQALPGRWTVRASTLSALRKRGNWSLSLTLRSVSEAEPLRLHCDASLTRPGRDGWHLLGVSRYQSRSAGFRWNGGPGGLLILRWRVAALNPQASVAILRLPRTLLAPAAVVVLARREADTDRLPRRLHAGYDLYGLAAGEADQLTWLARD